MEVPDLISKEVWEKARIAFANQENWVAYNNTLLFVHSDDIRFFPNRDDAEDFAFDNGIDKEHWHVTQIASLEDLKAKVESVMPGLVYQPIKLNGMVKEEQPSYFPKELLNKHKTIIMTAENLEYLKNQLKFLGFGEDIAVHLERKMKEGQTDFTLNASAVYGKDQMEAVLYFRHSMKDEKEAYFFNHYIATLVGKEENRSQFIYVNNKGQNVTFKESRNLISTRSVWKEITPREGNPYLAWLKRDLDNIDPKTGYPKLRQFTANHGFDLKEAIMRVEFKGMKYDDELKGLMRSLQKGNLADVIMIKDGREIKVSIEANPERRTLNMYDAKGEKMFYPMKQVEQKYGHAPSDAKREELNTVGEPKVKYEKKDLLAKNKPSNGLLEKKNTKSKSRSQKIS